MDLQDLSGRGGASKCHCLHPRQPRQGGQGLYPGALAYLQDYHSAFSAKLPGVHFGLNKGSKQEEQSVTTCTWPPGPKPLQLSKPACPAPTSSNQHAETTLHIWSTQRLLLYKTTFSKRRLRSHGSSPGFAGILWDQQCQCVTVFTFPYTLIEWVGALSRCSGLPAKPL